jgi:hypothetical protein
MILSYQDIFEEGSERQEIEAELTTEHPASSYGIPVIALPDGGALDLMSWVALDYRVVEATEAEREGLRQIGIG